MGLLDAPSTTYAGPRLTTWHRKLTAEISDTAVLILGDSTGAESSPTRWPRLLADKIAARWPRQTVIYRPWDDATKTYPSGSAVTVQTGTSGRTITIWNCSVSGQVVGYAFSNVGTITAGVTADVIFLNYGHNSPQDAPNYRALTHQAVNEYVAIYPNAAVVMTAQNPRATTDTTNYAPDEIRQQANYEYAVAEGFGLVDVDSDFRGYGNYAADLLLGDGLHPNGPGSIRWAGLAWDAIQPRTKRTPAGSPASRPQRLWIPAKAFEAADGSPTYGLNFGVPTWSLPASVLTSVVATVDYPSDWSLVNVDVHWSTATAPAAGARSIAGLASYQYLSSRTGTGTSTTIGTWTVNVAGNIAASASTTANRQSLFTIYNRAAFAGRPLGLKIARVGTDTTNDNLPQAMILLGVMIQRMY